MKIYHVTNKRSGIKILENGFKTSTIFAWGQLDMARDWQILHNKKDYIVVIDTEKANWSGLYYWIRNNKKNYRIDYILTGMLN